MLPDYKFMYCLMSGEVVIRRVKTFKKGLSVLKKFRVQMKNLEILYPDDTLRDEFGRARVSRIFVPFPVLMPPAKAIDQVRFVLNAPEYYAVYRDYLDPKRLSGLCYGDVNKIPPIGPLEKRKKEADQKQKEAEQKKLNL